MTASKVQYKHLLLMVATATIAMKFVRSLQCEDKKNRSAEIHILKIPKADSEHPGSLCSFRVAKKKERKPN